MTASNPRQPRPPIRMMTRRPSLVLALLAVAVAAAAPADVDPDHAQKMKRGLALFKDEVRPALTRYCLDCHGGKKTKGDFDLSDRAPLLESGAIDGGGKESRLYALLTHAEEPHMPYK